MTARIDIRPAAPDDVPLILQFIRELAEYEKLAHEVCATEAQLRATLFGARPAAEVVIASQDDVPVGFAVFFATYSTFLGRPGLYLEDLFVRPDARGHGIGRELLEYLARLTVERGWGQAGVARARLERAVDCVLQEARRRAARRLDGLPRHWCFAQEARAGLPG